MLPDPPFADADRPPDTTRTAVAVRLPAGGTAALAPSLVRRVDVEPFGFLDREREPHPVRHTFALTVGQPHAIEHGAEMAWSDSPYMRERMQARVDAVAAVRRAPLDLEAELRLLDEIDQTLARAPDEEAMAKAVKDEYRSAAQAAVAALEREHGPAVPRHAERPGLPRRVPGDTPRR